MGPIWLINDDAETVLDHLQPNSVDLVVTSPPYDELRKYTKDCTWSIEKCEVIINKLYSVMKDGGVVVWVVGDQTKNGSETGTSFKQALKFMDAGFKLNDTMIWQKKNPAKAPMKSEGANVPPHPPPPLVAEVANTLVASTSPIYTMSRSP